MTGHEGSAQTVLIVDRARTTCESLSMVLTSMGWAVKATTDPQEVLNKGMAIDIAVLVTAFDLSSITGEEFIRRMASRHSDLAVVVMVGPVGRFQMSRPDLVALPIIGVLTKPLQLELLERLMRRAWLWHSVPELRALLSILVELELFGLVNV